MIRVYMKSSGEYHTVTTDRNARTLQLLDRLALKGHYVQRVFARAEYLRKTTLTLRGKIAVAGRKLSYALTGYHDYGINLGEALKWWDGEDFSEDYEAQLMKEEREQT